MKTKSTLNSFSKSGKVKTLTSKQKLNILGGADLTKNQAEDFAIGHYTQVVWAKVQTDNGYFWISPS